MPYSAGQSAVIVAVPDAEPIVGEWRARFDAVAAQVIIFDGASASSPS